MTAKLAFLMVSYILVDKEVGSKKLSFRAGGLYSSPFSSPQTLMIFSQQSLALVQSGVLPFVFYPDNKIAS